MERYYVVLTNGSYSNYHITDLYYADHPIEQAEFDALDKIYQAEVQRLVEVHNYRHRDDPAACKWMEENDPHKVFIKRHNLTRVDCIECNSDD